MQTHLRTGVGVSHLHKRKWSCRKFQTEIWSPTQPIKWPEVTRPIYGTRSFMNGLHQAFGTGNTPSTTSTSIKLTQIHVL